jgi:polar amino acid transport system substrate-binding protein
MYVTSSGVKRVLCIAAVAAQFAAGADLAPTGTLRAAYLGLNPVQGSVDRATGKPAGVVPDLVMEFARRLKVPYALIPANDAGQVIASLKNHSADIGFLAFDAARAAEVAFSDSYEVMFNAYVVKAGLDGKTSADLDRAGLSIAAVRGQTQQLFLSKTIRNARVRIFDTMPDQAEVERLIAAGEVDAFGVNRQRAEESAEASAGKLRAMPDNFLTVEQAIVVDKSESANLALINRMLAELRADGFVKAAVERSKVRGVAAK